MKSIVKNKVVERLVTHFRIILSPVYRIIYRQEVVIAFMILWCVVAILYIATITISLLQELSNTKSAVQTNCAKA